MERIYSTREVAEQISSGESTVRKWSIALANSGYEFLTEKRGEVTSRMYVEHDILALRQFKEMMTWKNSTVESVADSVTKQYGERSRNLSDKRTVSVPSIERYDEVKSEIAELREMIQNQTEYIRRLTEKLDERDAEHERRIETRDEALMKTLRAIRENTRLQIAAAEEQKKSFWTRLFGGQ